MRIWCLTSLTLRGPEAYTNEAQYDHYHQELKGGERYVLTEIYIGCKNINFEFQIFREDVGLLRYKMDVSLFLEYFDIK